MFNDLSIPPELKQPTPRSVRMSKKLKHGVIMPFTLILLMLARGCADFFHGYKLLLLKKQAIDVVGQIQSDPFEAFYKTIRITAILSFFIGVFYFWIYFRKRSLVVRGHVVAAKIIEEKVYVSYPSFKYLMVTYEFTDSNGIIVRGKRDSVPLRSDPREESKKLLSQIFDTPIVLYNPKDSSKNILYPAMYVDCVLPEQR